MGVIEFVGVPGAGKSTVATLVAARLGATVRTINCHVGVDWGHRLSALAHQPRLAVRLGWIWARDPRKETLSWLINVARRARTSADVEGGTVIDEGVLHGLCSTALRVRVDVRQLVQHVPLPDVVVRLHLPHKVAHQRTQGSVRVVAALEGDDAATWYQHFALVTDKLCECLPVLVLDVDAENPVEVVAEDILNRLALLN